MRPRFHVFILVLATLLALNTHVFAADSPATEFSAANDLYAQGKFADAAAAYQKAVQSGTVSAALYFNLGNAWFKSGQPGRALAAYREAQRLAPRDSDVRANLQFIRNQVQGPTMSPGALERTLGTLSVNEWTALTLLPFWICLLLLVAIQLRPAWQPALRGYAWASGIATVVLALCLAGALSATSTHRAVVVANEAQVRYGPLENSDNAITVHDGAEVNVLDHKDDWVLVSVGDRNGWLKRDQVLLPENFLTRGGGGSSQP
jgi:tetratricopeptide (TPR) repeat protein